MLEFLLLIIIASLAVILYLGFMVRRKSDPYGETVRLSTLVFCVWLTSTVFWGTFYYSVKLAGLFDISIDRLIFIVILGFLLLGVFSEQVNLRENIGIELLMLCFVLVCVASMIQHGFTAVAPQFPSPWNVFITGYLFPFIVFVFAKNYLVYPRDLHLVFVVCFYIGVYLSIISFLEFFNLRQFVFPRYINDPTAWLHLGRARGPFLNAAFNGVALIIGYISAIYLLPEKAGLRRIFHIFFLLQFFPAIFFTQTRSVYLGFIFVNVTLLAVYRTKFPKWKLFALPITLLLIVTLFSIPKLLSADRRQGGVLQVEEVEVRLGLIQRSFAMILDQPFLGVGLAQFIPASLKEYRGRVQMAEGTDQQTQHNHLLGMMVELGALGVGIYVAIVFLLFRRLYSLTKAIPDTACINANTVLLLASTMIVYLVNNLFVEPSYFLFVNAAFFLFGGLTDGFYNRFVLEV